MLVNKLRIRSLTQAIRPKLTKGELPKLRPTAHLELRIKKTQSLRETYLELRQRSLTELFLRRQLRCLRCLDAWSSHLVVI